MRNNNRNRNRNRNKNDIKTILYSTNPHLLPQRQPHPHALPNLLTLPKNTQIPIAIINRIQIGPRVFRIQPILQHLAIILDLWQFPIIGIA